MFDTPVLLILFNRPELSEQNISLLQKVKPRYLYVAADGPRKQVPEDSYKCAQARKAIERINWDCELRTLFREENRGCGHGPAEAISWFFEQVEEGIILEDDCMPDPSFFYFCEHLLAKFRLDERIWIISGHNPLLKWYPGRMSYIYSRMGGTWGWASWRRAWKHFDYTAQAWFTEEGKEKVRKTLANERYYEHLSREFDTYFSTVRQDVWDFQWYFCRLLHGGYSIVPTLNLVSNVGSGADATHTFGLKTDAEASARYCLEFPLKEKEFGLDRRYDWLVFERFMNPAARSFLKKIVVKLVRLYTHTNG